MQGKFSDLKAIKIKFLTVLIQMEITDSLVHLMMQSSPFDKVFEFYLDVSGS